MPASPSAFAPGFLWGVATSAMQVEGHLAHTNWHDGLRHWRMEHPCGRACDFMRRYEEDLDRVRAMGLNAFRLSLEWGRIEPEPGVFSSEALAHYRQLIAACRERGLEPIVTLWHFAYPAWIDRELPGGWAHPDIVPVFVRYAERAGEALPDVRWWLTQNEPNAFAMNTCLLGAFPPAGGPFALAGHYTAYLENLVAAHQGAYDALKRTGPDRMVSANAFHFQPRGAAWPHTPDFVARLETLDYISLDYYFAHMPWEWPRLAFQWHWPVHPPGLEEAVMAYWRRFRRPVLIAENGLCHLGARPRADGWTRERYLAHHVRALERASARGAEIAGYMHWSLLDNWEMGSFEPRFGLYHVDFSHPDLPRVATPAVDVYREIARAGGVTPGLTARFRVGP